MSSSRQHDLIVSRRLHHSTQRECHLETCRGAANRSSGAHSIWLERRYFAQRRIIPRDQRPPRRESPEASAARRLQHAQARPSAKTAGVRAQTFLVDGIPAKETQRVARKQHADLLIIVDSERTKEVAMNALDLRWEWRTFGDDFGSAEARVISGAPPRQDSAELYVVSDHSNANTKIRGNRLEVRTLRQVDARGLELWEPSLTSTFPLAAAPLDAVYRAWAITPPPAGHASWTLATFLDDVLQKDHSLTLVAVTKSRRHTSVEGCLVEIADVTFDGLPTRTIAVEHADRERVWQAVEALGLSGRENTSYVKALQRFVAMRDRAA